MCGITGAAIYLTSNKKEILDKYIELLKASEIRGQDGTGIAWYGDEKFSTFRSNEKATIAFEHHFPVIEDYPARGVIGQNRLAVFGLDHKNDQPLVTDNLALVHNGNLYDFERVFQDKELLRDYQVDTELILRLIERYDRERITHIETAISTALHDIKGNYACLLIDKRNNVLVAFKKYKPLWYTSWNGATFFFSTERIGRKVFGDNAMREMKDGEILVFPI